MRRAIKRAVTSSRTSSSASNRDRLRFSDAGDTLIEVLLALVVLGLASVALLIAFSTSISASAEHRELATSDIALSAASQQAIASIDSQLNLFTGCQSLSYFQTNVQLIPSSPGSIPAGYTPTLTSVEYWNPTTATFTSMCTTDEPEEITITITHNGHTFTNSFVVDYPLAGATTQSGAGTAAKLVFTTPPSSTASTSIAFSQQPVLEIEDSNGNAVTTDLSPVIISIESGTSGALSGCSGSEVAGIVTFSGCALSEAGTYTLEATDGNLTTTLANDPTIVVTGSTTPYLVFNKEPVAAASGSPLATEPVIEVYIGTTLDTSWPNGTINLSTSGGVWPSGSPCSTVTVTSGIATVPSSCTFEGGTYYDPVSNETLDIPYTMAASGSGLIPATSTTFTVTGAGTATQLVFSTQPSGVASANPSTSFATQPVVEIEDAFGNVETTSSASVTMTLNSNSFGASLSGCTSTTTKGVATFSNCALNNYGTGFTLEAASNGLPSLSSAAFNITGLAYSMQFTTQPAAGASGSTLPTEPVVTIYDSHGYVVTASTAPITITASGGSLTLCSNLTPYEGVVTVATCNFAGIVGTNYTLTATQGSVSVISAPISPTVAGVPTQVAFTTEPVGGVAGSALTTQPVVKVEDSAGNVVLTSSATITLTSSPLTGTLTSCNNLQAVAGVVNVESCVFGGVLGTQYTMAAASANLTTGDSSNFFVTAPGPIDAITLGGCSSNIVWNATCSATATAVDAWGNIATSFNGGFTFAQTGGTGAVTGLTTVTAVNGVASDTVTGSIVGTAIIDATGSSDTSNGLTITVVGIPQTVAFYTNGTYTTTVTTGATTYSPSGGYQTYAQGSGGGTITFASSTPSICTINSSSGLVTIVGAGTCNLTADAGATAHYTDSGTTPFTLTISKAGNTITVTSTAPASATVGGSTYHATATATSGDAVVITSATTGVCTVSGGVVSFVSAGTCTLDFNDSGNANYLAAAQAQQTFTVGAGSNVITVTSAAPTGAVVGGSTYTPTATATSGDAVVITSGTPTICTIAAGKVSFIASGTCTLDFNDPGNANYVAAAQVTQSFSVGQGANSITITSTAPNPGIAPTGTYTPTATATSGDAVVITSATPSVCTITGGLVSFVNYGTCTLDFNDPGNANYVAATQVTQSITVKHTNAITITSTSPGSAVVGGATYTPTATATSGDVVTITSGTTAVCTISAGKVSFITAGTCTLDFNDPGNANYVAATQVTQSFTVGKGANSITVTSTAPGSAVVGGATYTPTATATSGDAVVITSATTSVCTISGGVVSFLTAGTCTLDFNDAGNANYVAAAQVAQTFTVGKGANSITVTSTAPNPGIAPSGATYTPTATATSGDAVVITSATPSVCTITGGVVSFVTFGTCTLDFNDPGNANYVAATQVTQSFTVKHTNAITITSTAPGSAVVGGATYTATATATSGDAVVITSATTSVCTISGGVVSFLTAGTCTLDFNDAGNANYVAATQVTQSFTVGKGANTITVTSTAPNPGIAPSGATYTPTATATSGDAVVITSATTSVCTITGGVVSFVTFGTCTLDFNDAGNANYVAAAQVTQSFTVKHTNTITVTSTAPAAAAVGGATYTPTATATSGDAVVITSATTSVCTITGGVVSFLTTGTCTLDFNDAGNGNYVAATQATQSFTVHKGTSVITVTSTAPNPGIAPSGATYTPTATATSGDAVVITSATTSVCTISGGVVTFVTFGTCTLDFNDAGNTNWSAATQVTQSFTVQHTNTITITSTAPGAATVGGATYHATATATSGDAVVITSATTGVCTVTGGVVSFVTVGTCTLDFNDAGNANYVAATQATQSFSVGKGANAITITSTAPNPGIAPSGATYTPTATATSGDAVVITSATTSVCTITGGVVSFVTFGTCTLDFNDAGNANYVAATQVTQNITVQHTNAITITSTAPGAATVGGATYHATATATSGDAVVITSATTGVCTVSSGIVSFVTAGTCTLDFNDAGNANYVAAGQVTQSFTVGKGANVITVTSTAPASAVVGGTTYTPTATATSGDVVVITSASTGVCSITGGVVSFLTAGTCTLDFNDAGNANYVAAGQVTQSFTVGKGTQATVVVTSTSGLIGGLVLTTSGGSGTGAVSYVAANGTATGCAVSGTTPYTLTAATPGGTCTVTATQAGDANWNSASSVATTVTLFGTSYWFGTSTAASTTVTTNAPTFTIPTTDPVLILATYESTSNNRTCTAPTGGAIGTATTVLTPPLWTVGANNFILCAYSAKGSGVAGSVTETFNHSTNDASIQVIALTGDANAAFNLAMSDTGFTSATPVWLLSGAPPVGSSEFLFGALTNGAAALPTWNTIAGYSPIGTLTISTGATAYEPTVYFGSPSAASLSGTTSATAAGWGTIGIEVTP